MRKLQILIGALLGLTSAPAFAQEEEGCFGCDTYLDEPSQAYMHYDWGLMLGINHFTGGGYHPANNPALMQCEAVHYPYNLFALGRNPEEEGLLRGFPSNGNDNTFAALVKLLLENDRAVLNMERSALQILDLDGMAVTRHLPLPRAATEKLADALSQARQQAFASQLAFVTWDFLGTRAGAVGAPFAAGVAHRFSASISPTTTELRGERYVLRRSED